MQKLVTIIFLALLLSIGSMAASLAAPQSGNFVKGKLTRVTSSVSETQYKLFDNMGRLTESSQITDGQTYTSKYTYNLSGALVEEEYPSGHKVKNEFESDGDLARIYGKVNPNATERTYANSFSYMPDGRIEKLRLGNGLWESAKFNSRLQVTEFNLGHGPAAGDLWKLQQEYGEIDGSGNLNTAKNTGNIARQTLSFNGLAQPFVTSYKYDSLYRLIEAKETSGTGGSAPQTWKQNFDYDRYGNRTGFTQDIHGQQLQINNLTLPTIDANTNRFTANQGYTFDKNGNLVNDPAYGGRQFIFNGDNKQKEVKDSVGNTIGLYYYDGEGKRVKKVTNTETTVFVYSAGKLIAEYSTAAPPQNPTTNYTITDQLGSPRILVNSLGEVVSRRDFMPFGEELAPDQNLRVPNLKYGTGDNVRQKFTGYQKDEETGLDFAEARMYENQHARFTAVDPLLASGKSANPQTFNRYVYVINNPLIFTDPTGLQVAAVPNGRWFRPTAPDGKDLTYRFQSTQPEGYEPVTERNHNGDLIGAFVGGMEGDRRQWVLKFDERGPLRDLGTIDLRTGKVNSNSLSDAEKNGFSVIMGPDFLHYGGVKDVSLELFTAAIPIGRAAGAGLGALRSGAGSRLAAAELADDALVARASEIHRVLDPIAQARRTTAIVDTEEGLRLVASSRNTLSPAQRAVLRPNEVAVTGQGHAEATALAAAALRGLTPARVAASRRICSSCENLIFTMRAKPLDPLRFLDPSQY